MPTVKLPLPEHLRKAMKAGVLTQKEAEALFKEAVENPDNPVPAHLKPADDRLFLFETPVKAMFRA